MVWNKKLLVFLNKAKENKIGTKARRLKEIVQKTNFLIPKTLVLTYDFYTYLVNYNNIKNPFLFNWENFKIPNKCVNKILKKIGKVFGDEYLVIRSSASCEDSPILSFAGQYSTFLNIRGRKNVLKAIQLCYASLFSTNARIYAKFYGVDLKKEKMAVMIQEAISVKISGVIFTVNPITYKKNVIVVECTKGFGDKLVSGEIKPEYFEISKKFLKKERNTLLFIIKETALKIEKIFNFPQNIEWGFDGKEFYIFQSRPITSLGNKPIKIKINKTILGLIGKGKPACFGQCEGKLKIIKDYKDYFKIKNGDVVLNEKEQKFSRKIIYYLSKINGIITKGGVLSHIAVIAREFNKPCLVEPLRFNAEKYENKKIFLDTFKGKIFFFKNKFQTQK